MMATTPIPTSMFTPARYWRRLAGCRYGTLVVRSSPATTSASWGVARRTSIAASERVGEIVIGRKSSFGKRRGSLGSHSCKTRLATRATCARPVAVPPAHRRGAHRVGVRPLGPTLALRDTQRHLGDGKQRRRRCRRRRRPGRLTGGDVRWLLRHRSCGPREQAGLLHRPGFRRAGRQGPTATAESSSRRSRCWVRRPGTYER